MSLFDAIRRRIAAWLIPARDYYEATRQSGRRSQLLSSGLQSARFDVSQASLYTLRSKSRYFEKNSPLVNKLADLWEQYTVGNGLVVQPDSSDPAWNLEAAAWWAYWSELPDVASRQSLGTMLSMLSRAWFIDGEVFVLQVKGDSGMPRLQCVEAHLVRTPRGMEMEPDIVDGIRVDPKTLRPLGYFVHTEAVKTGIEATWTEVAAQYVIHVFEPSRPGQLRGLPFLHAGLNTLHDLDDLHLLEMSAAKDAAKTSKVIKTTPQEFNPATLQAARVKGTLTLSTGATAETQRTEYYDDAVGEGKIILRPGDDYTQFATSRPSVVTRDYWQYLAEQVCASVGIPYVLVYPESMQGTVYRGAIDAAASFFSLRSAVMQSVVGRIYQYAMGWARYTQPTLRDAPADWKSIRISPPRAVNVDVGRNSKAVLEEIAGGASNFSRSYAVLGLDWRNELRQKAQEAAYIHDLSIEYGVDVAEISVLQQERKPAEPAEPADQQTQIDQTENENDDPMVEGAGSSQASRSR